jgi:hypothetical protein
MAESFVTFAAKVKLLAIKSYEGKLIILDSESSSE